MIRNRLFIRSLLFTAVLLLILNVSILHSISHVHSDLDSHPDCIFCKLENSLFALWLAMVILVFVLVRLHYTWTRNRARCAKPPFRGPITTRGSPTIPSI